MGVVLLHFLTMLAHAFFQRSAPRRRARYLTLLLCGVGLSFLIMYHVLPAPPKTPLSSMWSPRYSQSVSDEMSNFEVAVVVASQTKDDTTWLRDVFPTWDKKIYVTDDPSAPLTVPANRGREGMVYLTFVI